jgi:ribosomal protein L19
MFESTPRLRVGKFQSTYVVSHAREEIGQLQHIRSLSDASGIHRLLQIISRASKKILVVRHDSSYPLAGG